MDHVRLTHKTPQECGEYHGHTCNVCDLFICSVCGGAEGSLLPECPGRMLTPEEDQENYRHYCEKTGPFAEDDFGGRERDEDDGQQYGDPREEMEERLLR